VKGCVRLQLEGELRAVVDLLDALRQVRLNLIIEGNSRVRARLELEQTAVDEAGLGLRAEGGVGVRVERRRAADAVGDRAPRRGPVAVPAARVPAPRVEAAP
jgi:hypothetical protein